MANRNRDPQGGNYQFRESNLILTDITTHNVSTTKHGFAPKGDGDTSKFLNANGAYSTPAGGSGALIHIETKTITTTVTGPAAVIFTGLDGDTDIEYYMMLRVVHASIGTLEIRPNSLTTNLVEYRNRSNSGGTVLTTSTDWIISGDPATEYFGYINFHAAKVIDGIAQARYMIANLVSNGSASTEFIRTTGRWNETSTNLTSIEILAQNNIGEGSKFSLYKYAHA